MKPKAVKAEIVEEMGQIHFTAWRYREKGYDHVYVEARAQGGDVATVRLLLPHPRKP